MLLCSSRTRTVLRHERASTRMADERDTGPVRGDPQPSNGRRGGAVLPGPLHARGARGADAPLASGEAARPGPPVPRGGCENVSVDDDGDAGRAVAETRHGRVSPGARPAEADVRPDRLTVAVPAKGRLREPAVALLSDAGLGPEQPGERALAFPCRNAPVDVMLVRAADVPEYVQDGVVDCGITGADLVQERGADVDELLRLGFGSCTLEAAVPEEAPIESLDDLDGHRAATVYPRLAGRLLAERGLDVELIEVTGSVEVAPRLGLADG